MLFKAMEILGLLLHIIKFILVKRGSKMALGLGRRGDFICPGIPLYYSVHVLKYKITLVSCRD